MSGLISNYKMTALTKMDISKVSLNNQYQVNISGITADLKGYLGRYYNGPILIHLVTKKGKGYTFAEDAKDNFHGVNQQFAHTRIYIDSDFSFYIDDNYNVLKFFEGWMDYISGDDNSEFRRDDDVNYYRRLNYPMNTDRKIGYKCGSLTISKFEKNLGKSIKYSFINAFPKAMISIPVQYGGADLLKVNVQFAYDRYNLI